MKSIARILSAVIALAVVGTYSLHWMQNRPTVPVVARARVANALSARTAVPTNRIETRHYLITSTATRDRTQLVASTVESLHDAYVRFFGEMLGPDRDKRGMQLVLYRDRPEFQAHNDSMPWAEAFYRAPVCRAYFEEGARNPYHWMLHEATHQLNNEVAHFKLRKWMDEGLATYFGTSELRDGKLILGRIDAQTYPIWWLPRLSLSGDLQADIASGKIIPLRQVISGTGGPDIDHNVNLYYIEYWSLTHFLFHAGNGKYANGYKHLIATNGSVENFESAIGPVEKVQDEWYAYLRAKAAEISGPANSNVRIVTPI
jgi:hypothetical protein